MVTQAQIDSFHEFASRHVSGQQTDLTIAELFDLWQVRNPASAELADSVAAVKFAIADMENGNSGQAFSEFSLEMRQRFANSNGQ